MSTSQNTKSSGEQPDFDSVNLADSRNFGLLYDCYAPMIWRYSLARTRSRQDADEIISKTFLKVWEYVRARRKVKNIRAFLWTVANRLLIDFYRSNARTRARFADFSVVEESPPSVAPGLDERIVLKDQINEVATALHSLGRDDQLILTLRFIEELPLEEVALASGRSKNATAVAIHRALKRLRLALAVKREA